MKSIGNKLTVSNTIWTNLIFLEGLSSIAGSLKINSNSFIENLNGLDSLTFIGGDVYIAQNSNLSSFQALSSLTGIGYNLTIARNDRLIDFMGFENLNYISESLKIYGNDSLQSLIGLENIDAGSIEDLKIEDNYLLSTCDVQSVCNYLGSPNGSISISNNSIGCNSIAEIDSACNTTGILENSNPTMCIFPNPAQHEIYISNLNEYQISEINIYNYLGQRVLHKKEPKNSIDVSLIEQGLYIVEIVSDRIIINTKIIIY